MYFLAKYAVVSALNCDFVKDYEKLFLLLTKYLLQETL